MAHPPSFDDLPPPSFGLSAALPPPSSSSPSPFLSKVRSFDCFRTYHTPSPPSLPSIPIPGAPPSPPSPPPLYLTHSHDSCLSLRHQSAPMDVIQPSQWTSAGRARTRRRRSRKEEDEDGEEEEELDDQVAGAMEGRENEEEEEERLPPHEMLAKEWAAATSCGGSAFSLCQGVGRTLKGRDLCRVRNAILKQTGFI